MSQLKGAWEPLTGRFQDGVKFRVGKIVVGSVHYAMVARGDDPAYQIEIKLPGIFIKNDKYPTQELAKAALERAVTQWFDWIVQ